ncbi:MULTISPECIES: hypothetical protein [unclassified Brevundimonas]|nr:MULTISPECIES: hypothetical protein [unclassified Brevundimonas]
MISALAAATLLSATLLMVLHAAQPKPKRVPVRTRDARDVRRSRD